MGLYFGTYVNRIDRKGRVSVPAQFRTLLAQQNNGTDFNGCVLRPHHKLEALEASSMALMERIATSLDDGAMFSDDDMVMRTAIFAASRPVTFDPEGRIGIPEELSARIGLGESVAFVGMGNSFQLWRPDAYEAHQAATLAAMRERNLTLPKPSAG